MRIAMIVVAAAMLGACTGEPHRVDASRPTVSYSLRNQDEFQQASRRADDWCRENYGRRARLLDAGSGGYGEDIARFECV